MKRAIVIVMDGCGVGSAPDWQSFDETQPANTIGQVYEANPGLSLPTLERLGLRAAADGEGPRLMPKSQGGKDSVTGHWEMMGIELNERFPTYPDGFPASLRAEFEARIGRPAIWNGPASGTAIIEEHGAAMQASGHPIVYTSADSVFQIAVHEHAVPVATLYAWCEIAREICTGPNSVQRIIARPFIGKPGAYIRTEHRRDFPLPPPHNLCDEIGDVYGIGVVPELFSHRGFRATPRTQSNPEHAAAMAAAMQSDARFIFANFEDFDMKFGHRNDAAGFANCLSEFDRWLEEFITQVKPEDQLLITADHGNDPTTASTDHSREYVPLLSFPPVQSPPDAGFAFIGQCVRKHLA
jgi:phosphopentomutase